MKLTLLAGLLIVSGLVSAFATGCTRELTRGGEQIDRPLTVEQIPQVSVGGDEAIAGSTGAPETAATSPGAIVEGPVVSDDPEVQDLMNQARAAMMNDSWEEAIEILARIIEKEPANTRALYNMGYSYRQLGNAEKAVEYSLRAVEANPDELFVHQNLGYAYQLAGDLDKAMAEFEEELRRHPDEPSLASSAVELSRIYLQKGLMEEAFDAARHALALNASDPRCHAALAEVHMANGAFSDAVSSLERAVSISPNSGEYKKRLGDALWEAGRKEEARRAYQDAIALDSALAQDIPPDRLAEAVEAPAGTDSN